MKAFWDTNLFIYVVERHPSFHPLVLKQYETHKSLGETLITSAFTLGELISQPLRMGRTDLVLQYTNILLSGSLEVVPFSVDAARHYGEIRAHTGLKQPDAIQFACALAGGAEQFITNDHRLWNAKVAGIKSIRGIS